jgi:uncharacterized integral membrane protein (TIGR00697 family)
MVLERRVGLFIALSAAFVTALVVGDIVGSKLFELPVFGLSVTMSAGMLAFPLTFLLTDLLNEFYGKKAAHFVTWIGFAMALFSLAIVYAALAVPISPLTRAPGWGGVTEATFTSVFGGSQRILFASLAAYLVGQLVDIGVFHLLKRLSKNRLLWLRATGSTVVSQLIDTAVVQWLAWWGLLSSARIASIAATSYLVKLGIAVGLTPLIYAGHVVMERWLGIEPVRLGDDGEPVTHGAGESALVTAPAP